MDEIENTGPLIPVGVIVIVLAVLVAFSVVCALLVFGGNIIPLSGG